MPEIELAGCRPVPLAGYLKALGVLRLVAESDKADPDARGFWRADRFVLRTKLDRDALRAFFLHDYSPTPIIAPWNGGSGFYPKDAKDGISKLQSSSTKRYQSYREAIELGQRLIREGGLSERPSDEAKSALIAALRAGGDGRLVAWIDAAVALTLDRTAYPPLLGTGGNDGRLDFTNNFMQRLGELLRPEALSAPNDSGPALDDALFAAPAIGLSSAAVGQFAPGSAGGPNSATGYEGPARVNGWDFVLMLEGALVFAGGVSRRLEGAEAAYLSYPFTVRAAGAGFGTASLEEQGESRGELWAPLWGRPARFSEVKALFREGRISAGARPARDGLDAARAVSGLAADRRVLAFERYGFVKRQGLAYLATPLGRRVVRPNPASELLTDLDRGRWLDRLRRAGGTDAPAELRNAVRALEDGIFALVDRPDDRLAVQAVLIAVGRAARVLADRPKLREGPAQVPPPPTLGKNWIAEADDDTPEFRIAVALAGLRARLSAGANANPAEPASDLPLRAHLGPLDPDGLRYRSSWKDETGGPLAVWTAGGLVDNLCAVAGRRLLEHRQGTTSESPFDGRYGVGAADIVAFLDGAHLDKRIADLALGLAWVTPARPKLSPSRGAALPFTYAALKPLFTPQTVLARACEHLGREAPDLPLPPAVTTLLAAGRVKDAVRIAQERARASGLPAPFLDSRDRTERRADASFGRRLLAAMVLPISEPTVEACIDRAYPDADLVTRPNKTTQEPDDAA